MAIVYSRLWHRLAEKGMKKQDLREAAGISRSSIAKLGKNEIVTTEVLDKICVALDCNLSDIAEVTKETTPTVSNCYLLHESNGLQYRLNSFLQVLVALTLDLNVTVLRHSIFAKLTISVMTC